MAPEQARGARRRPPRPTVRARPRALRGAQRRQPDPRRRRRRDRAPDRRRASRRCAAPRRDLPRDVCDAVDARRPRPPRGPRRAVRAAARSCSPRCPTWPTSRDVAAADAGGRDPRRGRRATPHATRRAATGLDPRRRARSAAGPRLAAPTALRTARRATATPAGPRGRRRRGRRATLLALVAATARRRRAARRPPPAASPARLARRAAVCRGSAGWPRPRRCSPGVAAGTPGLALLLAAALLPVPFLLCAQRMVWSLPGRRARARARRHRRRLPRARRAGAQALAAARARARSARGGCCSPRPARPALSSVACERRRLPDPAAGEGSVVDVWTPRHRADRRRPSARALRGLGGGSGRPAALVRGRTAAHRHGRGGGLGDAPGRGDAARWRPRAGVADPRGLVAGALVAGGGCRRRARGATMGLIRRGGRDGLTSPSERHAPTTVRSRP